MCDEIFSLRDGRKVELEWTDHDEMKVWTHNSSRELIGSFHFMHVEGADEGGRGDYYLVTGMHLEGPAGQKAYINYGIGREIVRRVREIYPIVFGPDDGTTRSDGSHLTEMGPGFARKMVEEGLATREGDESFAWDDD